MKMFCAANTAPISLISQARLMEDDNMLLFSQTTTAVDTKQRLCLFIEASNNIWQCHVRLRVKLCMRACVCACVWLTAVCKWGLWESICLLQEGENGNISCETTCSP